MCELSDVSLKNLDLTTENLWEIFTFLQTEPSPAPRGWHQQRGYGLERLLFEMLRREHLEPRLSYKAAGEQIDGSFVLDHRVILIEAKWVAAEIAASQLYAFKGKVDGKLTGAIGVFLSVNGFSMDAVDALLRGKDLTVILATGEDLSIALEHGIGFGDMIRQKLRAAAEDGQVLLPIGASELREPAPPKPELDVRPVEARTVVDWSRQSVGEPDLSGNRPPKLIIGTEGYDDVAALRRLIQRVATERILNIDVEIFAAHGHKAAIRLSSSITRLAGPGDMIAIAVDADGPAKAVERKLKAELAEYAPTASLIIMEPELEGWLGVPHSEIQRMRRRRAVATAVESVNLHEFESRDKYFAELVRLLNQLDHSRNLALTSGVAESPQGAAPAPETGSNS